MSGKTCSFPGCSLPHFAKGWCNIHYQQAKRLAKAGVPMTPAYANQRKRGTPPRLDYVQRPCPRDDLEGPCHIFSGRKTPKGYGSVAANGRDIPAHRYIWERDVGTIPPGLEIDHQCRVRACINTKHLRVVNDQQQATENVVGIMWQLQMAKTHCVHGHEYTPDNTGQQRSGRYCKECKRIIARNRTRSIQ